LKGQAGGKHIFDQESNYDFGFLHVKAVDDAGHDKSLEKKVEWFKKSDEMVKELLLSLQKHKDEDDEIIIALTGDHTTPICIGDHTFEPVPFGVSTYSALSNELNIEKSDPNSEYTKKVLSLKDKVESFNEVSACEGALGRFPGG